MVKLCLYSSATAFSLFDGSTLNIYARDLNKGILNLRIRSFVKDALPKVISSEEDAFLQFSNNFLRILETPIFQSNAWIKRSERVREDREKQLPRIIDSREALTLPLGCSDNLTIN